MNTNKEENTRELKGLYKNVNISVKALNRIIVLCMVVILAVVLIDLQDPGFTVSFDPQGGTDVPSQKRMYGELLEEPEPPTREGYEFTGWYWDAACMEPWDPQVQTVEGTLTLYAGWRPCN